MRPFHDYPAPLPRTWAPLHDVDYLLHVLTWRVVVPMVLPFVGGWFAVGIFMEVMRHG